MAQNEKRVSATLFADHHQILLHDAQAEVDLSDAWSSKAVKDRIAVAPAAVGIGSERQDDVQVTAEVLEQAPGDPEGEHVSEASLAVASGELALRGNMDMLAGAKRLAVAPGTWRVRVSHQNLAKGREKIHVQLWPGRAQKPRVLTRWQPPAPPRMKARPAAKDAKGAAKLARTGAFEPALEVLLTLAAGGDAPAAASTVELLAYLGRWDELVPHASTVLAHPEALSTSNVFTDVCGLVRRASRELGDAGLVTRMAKLVPEHMAQARNATLLKDFEIDEPGPGRREHFDKAIEKAGSDRRFKGKPAELARHCFSLASVFGVSDEIVARWDPKAKHLGFNQAVDTARVLAHRGDGNVAWTVLASRLSDWYPVDRAQVAPVILLIDPWISRIMTAERCQHVLSTARGGA